MRPLAQDDPTTIGQYRLLGVLGAGGMGRVYLGRNAGGRTVAVKVVRPELADDSTFRVRFQREVTAAARVGGRFTAPVLDADVDADPPWLATGFVAGLSLREAIVAYGPLPEQSLVVLAAGLARALIAVHSAGIVHRDLKPSNVLLAVDGPKVIDFGIARAADDSVLTTTGNIVGSPGFMCPEQVTGSAPIGPPADVFALGGVIVYAASGTGPFGDGDTMSMLWRVVRESARLEAVPPRLRSIVAACLDKSPDARPTPQQLVDHLEQLGDTAGWLPPPVLEEVSRRAVALLDLEHTTEVRPSAVRAAVPSTFTMTGPTRAATTLDTPPNIPIGDRPTPVGPSHYVPMPAAGPPKRKVSALGVAGGVMLLVAAVAAGVLLWVNASDDSSPGADTTSQVVQTSQADEPTTPSTPSTQGSGPLPSAFVGTWKGKASNGIATYDIEVVLRDGNVGEELGTASNTLLNSRCDRAETLIGVSADAIVTRARLTGGADCSDEGQESTMTLRPDGSVDYSTPGMLGELTGRLQRQ